MQLALANQAWHKQTALSTKEDESVTDAFKT